MTGVSTVRKIRLVEERLTSVGMRLCCDLYKDASQWRETDDRLGVVPLDDKLPMYSRGAILFAGSIEAIDIWLDGIVWARDYDTMMRVSEASKRERKEQDLHNKHLAKRLKDEAIETIS